MDVTVRDEVVVGNRIIPRALDRYLARTGYDAQQTDELADPDRGDNLYQPVPGDAGVHGDFDGRSSDKSYQWWANTHRGRLLTGLTAAGLADAALVRR